MLSSGVKRELTWLITVLWIFLFLGWLIDSIYLSLILYTVFYITRQLWSMHRFERWIDNKTQQTHPPTSGFWSELTYLVSKKQRALEKHADLNLYKSEQFRSASMLIPDAIISLTKYNEIEWFNDASKSLLQIRRQDVGSKIESVVRHPDFIQYLRQKAHLEPIKISGLNRSARTFEIRVIPYFDTHKLLVVRDITELYQLAQVRRDFIANASHELRTPLTVLRGYLEIMSDHKDKLQNWVLPLEHMETQSHRMQSIIEDLLTLSTLEADSITAEKEWVDVPNMLEQLKADSHQLGHEGHEFHFEVDESLRLKGYPEAIKSVFTNLLSNAVRYSPDGGGISVRWYRQNDSVVFEVEDNGLGIAAEHIPRLTERFYRVDKDRSRVTGGTGLGLAIVKHVLERHHGRLEVESVLGKGSLFRCVCPIE